jgi:hypothetical protein
MARLGNISGKDAIKSVSEGRLGSNRASRRPRRDGQTGIRVNLSIPQHKELSVGTLRALIRNAGLSLDEFLNLL